MNSTFKFALAMLALGPAAALAIPEGPEFPSAAWTQREADNFARVGEAPREQGSSPVFVQRLQEQGLTNQVEWIQRAAADPSWLDPRSGNTDLSPLCTSWSMQCTGDPFRYPGTDSFYDREGEVTPVVFYDRGCARISGRVWAPTGSAAGANLPAVVIETGSVEAPETLYWWMAQALVRQGYVVMTFDVRGQGRSDLQTPTGDQGSNSNSTVFWDGLVDAIDFFRATPVMPYPHNATCAGTYPTVVMDFNPYAERIDRERLGIAGHSLGATGVSIVQGYGAPGADPWPGKLDAANPVKVVVAWDALHVGGSPAAVPRVPAMGQSSEYGLTPTIKAQPPDPEEHKTAYLAWRDAGIPVYQLTVRGSSHYEWSLIPTFPTTSWCPQAIDGHCVGGWGNPLAEHYSVAWLDRWLKHPGEKGYADADARLLADADWVDRYSFYDRSARAFPTRSGAMQRCEDIRAGCVPDTTDMTGTTGASGGGAFGLLSAALMALAALRRRMFR